MIVGIAGGSGSGKTTFARLIHENLGDERCCLLQQDAYYHDQSHCFDHDGGSVNFDHPDAVDFDLLVDHLEELKAGRSVSVPIYEFDSHRRLTKTNVLGAKPIVLLEGMLVLSSEAVREQLDLKIFIDAPEQVRLTRRLRRDVRERGRDRVGVERQFAEQVRPMHDCFVEPSKICADAVYSGEGAMEFSVREVLRQIG